MQRCGWNLPDIPKSPQPDTSSGVEPEENPTNFFSVSPVPQLPLRYSTHSPEQWRTKIITLWSFQTKRERERERKREREPSTVQRGTEQRKSHFCCLKAILCLFVCYCFLLSFRLHCLQPAPGSVVIPFVSGILNHWLWLHESSWPDCLCFSQYCKVVLLFKYLTEKYRRFKMSSEKCDFFPFLLDTWPRRKFTKLEQKAPPPLSPHVPLV